MEMDKNADLMEPILNAFQEYGYEGTSMAILSQACGLKKASLYHRFPDGKEQIASEAIKFMKNIVTTIDEAIDKATTPEEKVKILLARIDQFYQGGTHYCVLNALSMTKYDNITFKAELADLMNYMTQICINISASAGFSSEEAQLRGEECNVNIKGCLVITRITGDKNIYRETMARLGRILIGHDIEFIHANQQ